MANEQARKVVVNGIGVKAHQGVSFTTTKNSFQSPYHNVFGNYIFRCYQN
jgi:hypothetical protein